MHYNQKHSYSTILHTHMKESMQFFNVKSVICKNNLSTTNILHATSSHSVTNNSALIVDSKLSLVAI